MHKSIRLRLFDFLHTKQQLVSYLANCLAVLYFKIYINITRHRMLLAFRSPASRTFSSETKIAMLSLLNSLDPFQSFSWGFFIRLRLIFRRFNASRTCVTHEHTLHNKARVGPLEIPYFFFRLNVCDFFDFQDGMQLRFFKDIR